MKIKLIISILFILFSYSCKSPEFPRYYYDTKLFSRFEKGDQFTTENDDDITPEYVFDIKDLNQENIKVVVYKIYFYHGDYVKSYSHGYFTYRDNKLFYWGFIEDYLKSEDDVLRDIGEKSLAFTESQKNN